eukprot:SM000021S06508  [mRNA]  locus=s21:807316:810371:+ [translate_table: standard]
MELSSPVQRATSITTQKHEGLLGDIDLEHTGRPPDASAGGTSVEKSTNDSVIAETGTSREFEPRRGESSRMVVWRTDNRHAIIHVVKRLRAVTAYEAFDTGVLASAATLRQHPGFLTTPAALLQASLPVSRGGLGCSPVARAGQAAYLGSWAQVAAPICQRFQAHGNRTLERVVAEVESGPLPFQAALRAARDGLMAAYPDMSKQVVPFGHLAHTPDLRTQARFTALVDKAAYDQVDLAD